MAWAGAGTPSTGGDGTTMTSHVPVTWPENHHARVSSAQRRSTDLNNTKTLVPSLSPAKAPAAASPRFAAAPADSRPPTRVRFAPAPAEAEPCSSTVAPILCLDSRSQPPDATWRQLQSPRQPAQPDSARPSPRAAPRPGAAPPTAEPIASPVSLASPRHQQQAQPDVTRGGDDAATWRQLQAGRRLNLVMPAPQLPSETNLALAASPRMPSLLAASPAAASPRWDCSPRGGHHPLSPRAPTARPFSPAGPTTTTTSLSLSPRASTPRSQAYPSPRGSTPAPYSRPPGYIPSFAVSPRDAREEGRRFAVGSHLAGLS